MNPDSTPITDQADLPKDSDASATQQDNSSADEALILDDLLVEEVSIDGMCGVY
ncbi:MAG: mycofactocin precursor MftA [Vicinamibacterales bacterium]|nr:mycofactocin precursor MftA [Vicinamibacterales bacterium]